MRSQITGLFAIPVMRVEGVLDAALVAELARGIEAEATAANRKSDALSHTEVVDPAAKGAYARAAAAALPKVIEFGSLLFGETLPWIIKEMWTNRLETGGAQAMHSHANSFVSGVLYLTPTDPSAATTFHKPFGGTEFVFSNTNRRTRTGAYNGSRWVMPDVAAGDMALFPSYLLHEVPRNQGGRRLTVAFNAIPEKLDAWGYTVSLGR